MRSVHYVVGISQKKYIFRWRLKVLRLSSWSRIFQKIASFSAAL